MKHFVIIAAANLSLTATTAASEGFFFSSGVSIFGPQIEGGYQINDTFAARGFYAGGLGGEVTNIEDLGLTFEDLGLDTGTEEFLASGGLGAHGLIADYFPLGADRNWRLSAGIVQSRTYIDVEASAEGESATGSVQFKKDTAPLLTTGWRKVFGNNMMLAIDAGAYLNTFEATTTSTDVIDQADVDELNAELADIKAIPYISLTFGYKF